MTKNRETRDRGYRVGWRLQPVCGSWWTTEQSLDILRSSYVLSVCDYFLNMLYVMTTGQDRAMVAGSVQRRERRDEGPAFDEQPV